MTVHTKDKTVILDAGTGIGNFDRSFKRQMDGKCGRLDLLLSHFHMDHLMGLYGCSFLFDPQMEVHIYGERFGEKGLKECLCQMFGPPYWPLPLDQLPALVRFHEIQAGDVFLLEDQIRVQTLRGVHPGGSILYRLEEATQESEPASVVYGLDCELDGCDASEAERVCRSLWPLICDACYTEEELIDSGRDGDTVPSNGVGSCVRRAERSRHFSCIMNGAIRTCFCESRRKCHWRRTQPVCLRGKAWLSKYMDNDGR